MSGPPGRVTGWGADGDSRPEECTCCTWNLCGTAFRPHRVATNSGDEARGSGGQGLPRLAVRATGRGQGSSPGHRGSRKPGGGESGWEGNGPRGQKPQPVGTMGKPQAAGFTLEPRDTVRTRTGGKLGSRDTTRYVPDAPGCDNQSGRLMPRSRRHAARTPARSARRHAPEQLETEQFSEKGLKYI